MITESAVWQQLEQIKDPEIPVVSLIEMGIVRAVQIDNESVTVTITPTFSGCPALVVMRQEIEKGLRQLGAAQVTVRTVLSPAWSSDWITEEGRQKLQGFGLAPPPKIGSRSMMLTFFDPVACPRCHSTNTSLKNSFGSTLCRAIYLCNECREPFEQFKPL